MVSIKNPWDAHSARPPMLFVAGTKKLGHATFLNPLMEPGLAQLYLTPALRVNEKDVSSLAAGYSLYKTPSLTVLDFDDPSRIVQNLAELLKGNEATSCALSTRFRTQSFLSKALWGNENDGDFWKVFRTNWSCFKPFIGTPRSGQELEEAIESLSDTNYCALLCEMQRIGCREHDAVLKRQDDAEAFYDVMSLYFVFGSRNYSAFADANTPSCIHIQEPGRDAYTYDGYTFGGVTMLKTRVTAQWEPLMDGPAGEAKLPPITPVGHAFRPAWAPIMPNNPWASRRHLNF